MGQKSVDCSGGNLTEVPSDVPTDVQLLDLSNNLIQNITSVIEYNLTEIVTLDLSNNDLQSLQQRMFRNLRNLQSLDLSFNSIKTSDDDVFENLNLLSHLDLSWNNLTQIGADFLDGVSDLQVLNLSNNPIHEIHQDIFTDVSALRSLDLANTSYWILDDRIFGNLENLTDLNLQHNYITNISSFRSSFQDAISLRSLQLAFNNIENLTAYSFDHWSSLEELDLSHNWISSLEEHTFEGLQKLKTLKLDNNLLVYITLPVFSPLVSLRRLSLSEMAEMMYLGKQSFHGLKNLTYLNLSSNEKLGFLHEEIFHGLEEMKFLNLSHNNISHLSESTFPMPSNFSVDISGNNFECDCHLEWLVRKINSKSAQNRGTQFVNVENIFCKYLNKSVLPLQSLYNVSLQCQSTHASAAQVEIKFALGSSVRITCPFVDYPPPTITWITPHKLNLTVDLAHPISFLDHPSILDTRENGSYHIGHYWHNSDSYYPELEDRKDRIIILRDGSLYIDYFLRTDTGPYKCIIDSTQNMSTVLFLVWIDNDIFIEVKVMSLLVGFGCAASFFMLNLIQVFIMALARRCINQRRREAIAQFVDNFEKYRTAKLGSLKDNYNAQMARIRDTYRNRMDKLSDSYTNQMMRIREGASQIKEGTVPPSRHYPRQIPQSAEENTRL
ncbi:hypothetical protein FSP39_006423 [Pinctada imbricata]|uniref:Ig-like domain-containing protein n=1 Tax=Pinctada imbricata TaxID=66713 RepID=A0AA89C8I4_PINIB|nr:hypothetical protein FSP39_006423 [Pinctada imbricata]